jgi:hypothetical protein
MVVILESKASALGWTGFAIGGVKSVMIFPVFRPNISTDFIGGYSCFTPSV